MTLTVTATASTLAPLLRREEGDNYQIFFQELKAIQEQYSAETDPLSCRLRSWAENILVILRGHDFSHHMEASAIEGAVYQLMILDLILLDSFNLEEAPTFELLTISDAIELLKTEAIKHTMREVVKRHPFANSIVVWMGRALIKLRTSENLLVTRNHRAELEAHHQECLRVVEECQGIIRQFREYSQNLTANYRRIEAENKTRMDQEAQASAARHKQAADNTIAWTRSIEAHNRGLTQKVDQMQQQVLAQHRTISGLSQKKQTMEKEMREYRAYIEDLTKKVVDLGSRPPTVIVEKETMCVIS